jgi:hypothetical protein
MDDRLSLRVKQQIAKCDETIRESNTVIESSKDWLEVFHKKPGAVSDFTDRPHESGRLS